MPSAPAAASVWQAPQLIWNSSRSCRTLAGTDPSGEASLDPCLASAQNGSATRQTIAKMPKVMKGRLLIPLPPTLDGAGGAGILTAPIPGPVGGGQKARGGGHGRGPAGTVACGRPARGGHSTC